MQIISSTLLYVKIIDVGQIFRLCPLIRWQPSIASSWLTPGLLYRCGCRLLSSRSHRGLLVRFSLFNRMIFGFRGPPPGETTIVLVFGDLPLRGWVGASWLPTMASSFPLPCRIFSPPSYGLIPIIVAPILLPLFSLWSDAGLRDSSAWSGKPGVSMMRRVLMCHLWSCANTIIFLFLLSPLSCEFGLCQGHCQYD